MSLQKAAQPRHLICANLCRMGFTEHYINRSVNLYEKHYNIIKIGYDMEIIQEIIFRLTIKDKLKQCQIIYYSKVNIKQALETMGFCSRYIGIAIQAYGNLYGISSYDIQIITKHIMNLRADDYRKKQQQQLAKIKVNCKVDKRWSNSAISYDTNDTGDTINNSRTQTISIDNIINNNYSGYLWKQSSTQRKKWQKRWFVLTNDELQYFKDCDKATKYLNSENNQSNQSFKNRKEYIGNIQTCRVNKVAIEKHKYVISVTTPVQRTYLLETYSIAEYDKWFNVLSSQTQMQMNKYSTTLTVNEEKNSNDYNYYNEKQRLLLKIQSINKLCADCNQLTPEWISINIGVLICFDCAAIHRDLGCAVTKIKSLMLDNLDINTLKCIVNIGGNKKLNQQLLEYNLCKTHKINHKTCTRKQREEFICFKYVKKIYVNTNKLSNVNINQYLFNCALSNDCFGIIFALYNNANINYAFKRKNNMTALQASILKNNNEAQRLLVANEALPMVQI